MLGLRRLYIILASLASVTVIVSIGVCVATNSIVNSGKLIPLINSNQNDVTVHYSSSTGSILTVFHFKDLEVAGEDSNVKWTLKIKDGQIAPSLWRLLRKIFHTSKTKVSGVSFRLEIKKPVESKPGPVDGYKNNFRIEIGGIEIDNLYDLTIGKFSFRSTAKTSLTSGFYFWPEYELRIDPSHFKTKTEFAESDFKFQLDRVRFKESPGLTALRELSAELKFNGVSEDLSFMNYYFRSVPWLTMGGSGVRLDSFVKISKGIVDPASKATLDVKQLELTAGRLKWTGSGLIKFAPPNLTVDFSDYLIMPISARGKGLKFVASSPKIDLGNPTADLDLVFDLKPLKVTQLSGLNGYFPAFKSLKFGKGSVEVSANVQLSTLTHKASGQFRAAGRNLVTKLFDNLIETDLDLLASPDEINPDKQTLHFSNVDLGFSKLTLSGDGHRGSAQIQNWWGKLNVTDARLYTAQHDIFSGVFKLSGRDGKPFLLGLLNAGTLPIDLTTLSSMRDMTAVSTIKADQDLISFKEFQFNSSTLKAQGELEIKGGGKFGNIKVQHPLHSFEIEFNGKKTKLK